MVNPVPGHGVTTPYGKRGSYWSCDENSAGDGIHTGVDYAAPSGTKVVAARGGKVVHCSHGSAFGSHQIEVTPGDGTRDFYAHMRTRVANGTKVAAGDKVGEVGAEGNVTGAHLHFERHKVASGGWACSVVVDPKPSISADGPEDDWRAGGDVYVAKLRLEQTDSDSVARLRWRLENHDAMPGSHRPGYGSTYGQECLEAVRYWQRNINGSGDSDAAPGPTDGTSMSNAQANRLFGDAYNVIET